MMIEGTRPAGPIARTRQRTQNLKEANRLQPLSFGYEVGESLVLSIERAARRRRRGENAAPGSNGGGSTVAAPARSPPPEEPNPRQPRRRRRPLSAEAQVYAAQVRDPTHYETEVRAGWPAPRAVPALPSPAATSTTSTTTLPEARLVRTGSVMLSFDPTRQRRTKALPPGSGYPDKCAQVSAEHGARTAARAADTGPTSLVRGTECAEKATLPVASAHGPRFFAGVKPLPPRAPGLPPAIARKPGLLATAPTTQQPSPAVLPVAAIQAAAEAKAKAAPSGAFVRAPAGVVVAVGDRHPSVRRPRLGVADPAGYQVASSHFTPGFSAVACAPGRPTGWHDWPGPGARGQSSSAFSEASLVSSKEPRG